MIKIFDIAFQSLDQLDVPNLEAIRSVSSTLVVQKDQPVADVARQVARDKYEFVLVVGDDDGICGFVEPGYVKDALYGYRQHEPASFSEGIVKLGQASIGRLTKEFPTRIRPKLRYCGTGRHWTSEDPCSEHE